MLLVFIGTKAQFIKTAPILLELDRRSLPYRLVYTGQHSETFADLEVGFGTRAADENWVPNNEADTRTTFAYWTFDFWRRAWDWRRERRVMPIRMVLVHGDTASTLYCALLARLCRLPVCHVEAGLRSSSLLDPFPEEFIRRIVSRLTSVHFAPSQAAMRNLSMVRGEVFNSNGNTLIDALRVSLSRGGGGSSGRGGYVVVSIHRNENLSNRRTFDFLMSQIESISQDIAVKFVLHPATRAKLAASEWGGRLGASRGVSILPRMGHTDFLRLLINASSLLTDGGSNQEEAAALGMPCLLLRRHTERLDGIGDTVELSGLKPGVIQEFVHRHASLPWSRRPLDESAPSATIVEKLIASGVFR